MFNQLSEKLTGALEKLRGIGRLTKENIQSTLIDIRRALLEADVALLTIESFIKQIQNQAIGKQVIKNIRPGDALIKLVQDTLTQTLGSTQSDINLNATPPIILLITGLQGSGKTTTAAKLAYWLKNKKKKNVMLASADVYRPAAIEQLEILAKQIQVPCFQTTNKIKPVDIIKNATAAAKTQYLDVLIIDTAGRLHIDDKMMEEIDNLNQLAKPNETLLVVDSMAGQDAIHVAQAFNSRLSLTGIILTKTDGDSRGGAALSLRHTTGKPIKFIGTGEKVNALETFHPDRIASRILGMGDIVSLVEEAQTKIDQKKAEKIAKKLKKGKRFDLNDFLEQLQQMKKVGGLKSLLGKLPRISQLPKASAAMLDDKLLVKMESIILSMTLQERQFPAIINGSRKRRISKGSGTLPQDINRLLKQFLQMQKMLKRFKGKNASHLMKQFPRNPY